MVLLCLFSLYLIHWDRNHRLLTSRNVRSIIYAETHVAKIILQDAGSRTGISLVPSPSPHVREEGLL